MEALLGLLLLGVWFYFGGTSETWQEREVRNSINATREYTREMLKLEQERARRSR